MSLISEQVKGLRELALKNIENPNAMFLKRCADTIEELSTKLAAQNMERSTAYYNDGWIPCSERLPEHDEKYLCTYIFHKHYDMPFVQVLDYYATDKSPHFQHTLGDSGMKVLAWMPLPEPWKGE